VARSGYVYILFPPYCVPHQVPSYQPLHHTNPHGRPPANNPHPPVFLIPTEIYPTTARALGTSISVVIWGFSNFTITLITPILFNNLGCWLFLVFALTNVFAGVYTYLYQPESGGRSFEENQEFFEKAKEEGSWRVSRVGRGEWLRFPGAEDESGETRPLLGRVREQVE